MLEFIGFLLLGLLKFLGICLLVLLMLILLILFSVLFIPIRYQFHGEYHPASDTQTRIFAICAQVQWFFRLLSVVFSYDTTGSKIQVRICGLDLERLRKWKQNRGKKKAKKQAQSSEIEGQRKEESEICDAIDFSETIQNEENETTIEELQSEEDETVIEELQSEENETEVETPQSEEDETEIETLQREKDKTKKKEKQASVITKISIKIKSMKEGFWQKWQSLKKQKEGLQEQWNSIQKKIKWLDAELHDEMNHVVLAVIWKEACNLLHHYGPRKMQVNVSFSMGDPSLTGKLLGGIALLPAVYQKNCFIIPDFEAEKMFADGEFRLKGHIRSCHLLFGFLRMILKPEVRKTYHKFRTKNP